MANPKENSADPASPSPVRNLTCTCCGEYHRGRQWWNLDTGYGLCPDCIDYCHRNRTDADFDQNYGVRGVHYDVKEPT